MSWSDYAKLPVFKGPNMFAEDKMQRIVKRVKKSWRYCNNFLTPKMKPWCKYITEMEAQKKAQEEATRNSTAANGCNFNYAAAQIGNFSAMDNFDNESASSCYDSYFCISENNQQFINTITIVTMIALIVGLLGHGVYLPSLLKITSKKAKFFFYMIVIALADFLYIILGAIIFISCGLGGSLDSQLESYKSAAVNVVPRGLPLMDFSFLLAAWLFTSLIMDRYKFHSNYGAVEQGGKLHLLLSTIGMIVAFAFYTVPKFGEFRISVDENNSTKVMELYGGVPQFSSLMSMMKITFELAIPCALLITFISLIRSNSNYNTDRHANGNLSTVSEKKGFLYDKRTAKENFSTSFLLWISIALSTLLIIKAVLLLASQVLKSNKALVLILRYLEFAMTIFFYFLRPLLFLIRCKLNLNGSPRIQMPYENKYKKCDTNVTMETTQDEIR